MERSYRYVSYIACVQYLRNIDVLLKNKIVKQTRQVFEVEQSCDCVAKLTLRLTIARNYYLTY